MSYNQRKPKKRARVIFTNIIRNGVTKFQGTKFGQIRKKLEFRRKLTEYLKRTVNETINIQDVNRWAKTHRWIDPSPESAPESEPLVSHHEDEDDSSDDDDDDEGFDSSESSDEDISVVEEGQVVQEVIDVSDDIEVDDVPSVNVPENRRGEAAVSQVVMPERVIRPTGKAAVEPHCSISGPSWPPTVPKMNLDISGILNDALKKHQLFQIVLTPQGQNTMQQISGCEDTPSVIYGDHPQGSLAPPQTMAAAPPPPPKKGEPKKVPQTRPVLVGPGPTNFEKMEHRTPRRDHETMTSSQGPPPPQKAQHVAPQILPVLRPKVDPQCRARAPRRDQGTTPQVPPPSKNAQHCVCQTRPVVCPINFVKVEPQAKAPRRGQEIMTSPKVQGAPPLSNGVGDRNPGKVVAVSSPPPVPVASSSSASNAQIVQGSRKGKKFPQFGKLVTTPTTTSTYPNATIDIDVSAMASEWRRMTATRDHPVKKTERILAVLSSIISVVHDILEDCDVDKLTQIPGLLVLFEMYGNDLSRSMLGLTRAQLSRVRQIQTENIGLVQLEEE